MHKRFWILLAALTVSAAFLACSKPAPAPVEDPAVAQEEIEREREATRRAEATAALESRLSAAQASIAQLGDAAGSAQLPTELGDSIGRLRAELDKHQSEMAKLETAGDDAWDATRNRLQQTLDSFESVSAAVKKSLADWRQREQAALEARAGGETLIDPATGLIQGLDGGDYEQYLISVVERVQQRLRALGSYAGPADGVFDAPLRTAIGGFQEQQELAVSGVPSPRTRSRLFAE